MLRDMVAPEYRLAVTEMMKKEIRKMGLVPTDLDAVYDSAEATKAPEGTGGLLPAGDYEGVILAAEVRPGMKPWVDAELSLKIQVDEGDQSGKTTFCDIELAPNTGKDGQPNPKKLGFVKAQLANLGWTGRLSEVEHNTNSFLGARVAFRQKVDNHLEEDGTPDQYARINPNSGQPYIDREVYLNELLQPGFTAPAASTQSAEPTVY